MTELLLPYQEGDTSSHSAPATFAPPHGIVLPATTAGSDSYVLESKDEGGYYYTTNGDVNVMDIERVGLRGFYEPRRKELQQQRQDPLSVTEGGIAINMQARPSSQSQKTSVHPNTGGRVHQEPAEDDHTLKHLRIAASRHEKRNSDNNTTESPEAYRTRIAQARRTNSKVVPPPCPQTTRGENGYTPPQATDQAEQSQSYVPPGVQSGQQSANGRDRITIDEYDIMLSSSVPENNVVSPPDHPHQNYGPVYIPHPSALTYQQQLEVEGYGWIFTRDGWVHEDPRMKVQSCNNMPGPYHHSNSDGLNAPVPAPSSSAPPQLEHCSKPIKRVTFSDIQIRTYETILNDNPACSNGPSIGIGWRYFPGSYSTTVDEHEARLCYIYGTTHRGEPLSALPEELVLHRLEREDMLLSAGYTKQDLVDNVRALKKAKRERCQTVGNLPAMPIEEKVEVVRRTVKRWVLKKKRTRHLYDEWKMQSESTGEQSAAAAVAAAAPAKPTTKLKACGIPSYQPPAMQPPDHGTYQPPILKSQPPPK